MTDDERGVLLTTMGVRSTLTWEENLIKIECQNSLASFVRHAWPIIEPIQQYSENWHIPFVASHLEAVLDGTIPNLIVNIPPGAMKSLLCSVFFPAWCLANQPSIRFYGVSYHDTLSQRDNGKTRQIVQSKWFQRLWGDATKINRDVNKKRYFETYAGGFRASTSTGGPLTGEHPDIVLIDDPINARKAQSAALRESTNKWYDETVPTRGASRGVRCIIAMQRLHPDDLSGHILKKNGGSDKYLHDLTDWDHICLPMRAEPDRMPTTRLGHNDHRDPGDLLWPDLFNEATVAKLERSMGQMLTAGQLQQRPVPLGGSMFKREWFEILEAHVLGLGI